MPKLDALAALFFALACCPSTARSLVVYDTYPLGQGEFSAILGQFQGNDLQYAYPFDMPPDSGNRPLATILLRIGHSPDVGTPKGDFTLLLRADETGVPGAVLEAWTITNDLPSEIDVSFDSVMQPLLLQGAAYWLDLKVEAGTGQGLWLGTPPPTMDFLFAQTGVLDPTWLAPSSPFNVGLTLATVTVPEPDSSWLGAVGAAALASLRRQRARA